MNCQEIETSLIAYLDTKAKPAERRQVEAHLAGCTACSKRAAEFRLVWGVLDELPVITPTPQFDSAVRARVAQEAARRGFWFASMPGMRPAARLAFSAAALLMFSVWLVSFSPAPRPGASLPQVAQSSDSEFKMIKNLPVLEDYDVLANFDALSELPAGQADVQPSKQPPM